ncbi:MAG: hypothetical protein JWM36_1672 [Hyphomicrobiales bacterium]|nr:hypothetical protein [Hyphomicrobiales bacterium]
MKFLATLMVGALCVPGLALALDRAAPDAKAAPGAEAPAKAAASRQVTSGCQVQAKNLCAPAGAARLTAASGDVLLSRGAGFAEIKPGTALVAGDRLLVSQGSAQLALGPSCQTNLRAHSMVTLVQKDGTLCAARLSSDPDTLAQGRGGDEQGGEGGGGFTAGPYMPVAMVALGGLAVAVGAGAGHGHRCGNSANTPAGDRCPLSK